MALAKIYPNGINEIDVPATESIAISNYGGGIAKIYYLITDANRPPAYQFQQTLENSGVVLGAFTNGQKVKIEAGNSVVTYDIGTAPDTGIGNADTVGGLSPSQFARSDVDDTIAGVITFSSNDSYPITLTGTSNNKILLDGTNPTIRFQEASTNKMYLQWHSDGYIYLVNAESLDIIRLGGTAGFEYSPDNGSNYYTVFYSGNTLSQYMSQGAITAQTTDDTLTAAELDTRIITVDQGAAGTSTQTLPLATAMDSYFTGVNDDFGFEFSVINISTNAAEDCTVATNTGWTLVGSMVVESFDADRARSTGRFFARKTGTGAWTLYRIA